MPPVGFEPTTHRLKACSSNQLSYGGGPILPPEDQRTLPGVSSCPGPGKEPVARRPAPLARGSCRRPPPKQLDLATHRSSWGSPAAATHAQGESVRGRCEHLNHLRVHGRGSGRDERFGRAWRESLPGPRLPHPVRGLNSGRRATRDDAGNRERGRSVRWILGGRRRSGSRPAGRPRRCLDRARQPCWPRRARPPPSRSHRRCSAGRRGPASPSP